MSSSLSSSINISRAVKSNPQQLVSLGGMYQPLAIGRELVRPRARPPVAPAPASGQRQHQSSLSAEPSSHQICRCRSDRIGSDYSLRLTPVTCLSLSLSHTHAHANYRSDWPISPAKLIAIFVFMCACDANDYHYYSLGAFRLSSKLSAALGSLYLSQVSHRAHLRPIWFRLRLEVQIEPKRMRADDAVQVSNLMVCSRNDQ